MIKLKVSELMEKKGVDALDLVGRANVAYGTALRLSSGEAKAISFDVLDSLCKFFNAKVEDILEYIPET